MRRLVLLVLCALGLALPSTADAAAKYSREGFSLPSDERPSVLVVFADLHDYAYDDRGQQIRNHEWEAVAENNVVNYLAGSPLATAFDLHFESAQATESAAQY